MMAAAVKLAGPAPLRRAQGVGELAVAGAACLAPGRSAALLVAVVFAGFTAVHLRAIGCGAGGCDCFGPAESVDPRRATGPGRAAALTALVATFAALAAALPAPSLRELAARDPTGAAWTLIAALAAALVWRVAFSGPALLEAIVGVSARRLAGPPDPADTPVRGGADDPADAPLRGAASEPGGAAMRGSTAEPGGARERDRGDSIIRRSFLLRTAVVGSALATAPVRYLLYPGTALAAVVRPWECAGGLCTDGYTGFCCEINPGGANTCPADTFAGGWWMCTDYTGRQLCSGEGVRYYVDCNALPGRPFPGGCRCANGSCDHRKIACNVFRYGQCNTQIAGTTAVVCRMVLCESPATVPELNCSSSLAIDDAVCGHEAPCLEPPAIAVSGAGGV